MVASVLPPERISFGTILDESRHCCGSAGWLIEQAGLKGKSEGGAIVSDLHANFILNRGDATATEVINLILKVRERVRRSHGLLLEPEVNLLGKSWDQFLS